MPWNSQGGGGGPWGGGGGGGQGPWGRGSSGGGGGGGPQPPDFEEMLRRGQDRLKRSMPGGFGTGRGIALVLIAAFAVWMLSGLYRVQPSEQGVVLLFGRFIQVTEPGLHWFFPAPVGSVLTPNVTQVRRVDVGFRGGDGGRVSAARKVPEESLMLTGDQNIVDLQFTVFWRVGDAEKYLFNIRDPETTVKVASESAMREVIGQSNLQAALTGGREEIGQRTRDLTQKILDSYNAGISIDSVQLQEVDPPAKVIDAFNEVQRARQDKERKINEAEAYRNKVVPTARGEAEKMIQGATAYMERVTREAEGEAERFMSIFEQYKASKDVTTKRIYLETLSEILRDANKVIIDSDRGGSGVVPYLPLPELEARRKEERTMTSGEREMSR